MKLQQQQLAEERRKLRDMSEQHKMMLTQSIHKITAKIKDMEPEYAIITYIHIHIHIHIDSIFLIHQYHGYHGASYEYVSCVMCHDTTCDVLFSEIDVKSLPLPPQLKQHLIV